MPTVEEFAAWRGVSSQRVRELLRSGALPGHRLGKRMWLIDDTAYSVRIPVGRPLQSAGAWALIDRLSRPETDQPGARRVNLRVADLRVASDRVGQLSSWLRERGRRLSFAASAVDSIQLLNDRRVIRSGVSDERSGLIADGRVEVWLRDPGRLNELRSDWALSPDSSGNVTLHVGPTFETTASPLGLVLADLADWTGGAEIAAAARLLALHFGEIAPGRTGATARTKVGSQDAVGDFNRRDK